MSAGHYSHGGSALAPFCLEIVSYVLTGIVAFLMCIREAKAAVLSLFREHYRRLRHFTGAG